MSWRDSASGSSSFHGGGGYAGNNGNVGAGTGYGGNGGSNYSRTGGLGGGLSTGSRWYGNTAYGPAGGGAVGYATARDGGGGYSLGGMGPSMRQYSNFRNPDGTPTFTNASGPVTARNAGQAAGILSALANRQPNAVAPGRPRQNVPPQTMIGRPAQQQAVGGLLHAILGGGGMLGYGLNPANGGAWTPAGTAYYGGYNSYGKPITDRVPMDPNFGGNTFNSDTGAFGGMSTHYKYGGMPSPTGEERIIPRY